MTRRTLGGIEGDVFTGWRRYYCYLHNRHGVVVRKVKRSANRRERRNARREIAQQLEQGKG